MNDISEKICVTRGVADLVRWDWRQREYGREILPFILCRRLYQVLALALEAVWTADDIARKLPRST